MSIPSPATLQSLSGIKDKFVYEAIRTLLQVVNSIAASLGNEYPITTPSGANTDFIIQHNLGRVVDSWLVTYKGAACDIYLSPSTQSDNILTLRATVASVAIKVVLL